MYINYNDKNKIKSLFGAIKSGSEYVFDSEKRQKLEDTIELASDINKIKNKVRGLKDRYQNDKDFSTKVDIGVGAGGALALAGIGTLAYKLFKNKKNKNNGGSK